MRRIETKTAAFAALLCAQACACAIPQRPVEQPTGKKAWIAVLSGEMPGS